ncbi:hypothetical protein HDU84_004325 [Entophlyctis sp. JEL0112]|nr:hypothetical protein HDU84_004325 [Entophlyctis sp. JEL0112]
MFVQAIFKTVINGRNKYGDLANNGMLVNLVATDTEKLGGFSWVVFVFSQWCFAIVSMPFALYFLYTLVGNGAFVGVGILFISAIAGKSVASVLARSQKRLQECRDTRSRIVKQVLCSLKVTKLERLELAWIKKLTDARAVELLQLWNVQLLSAGNTFLASVFSLCVPLSMFGWVVLVDGRQLDAATAFSALAWISQQQWSISTLPMIFNLWSALEPSLFRIVTFLKSSIDTLQVDNQACKNITHEAGEIHLSCDSDGLKASLNVARGELVVIIGPTGSGKSRLLTSITAQSSTDAICLHGNAALVLQNPFLLNATIRENILFGLPLVEEKLQECLERTELIPDLAVLHSGLNAVAGPSGVQLSGGQKARALYSDSDCYLLDDILSAVDRTTGTRIWNNVIAFLKSKMKTIVLITHQLHFLSRAEVDRVVLMNAGRIQAMGLFNELAHDPHVEKCLEFLAQDDSSKAEKRKSLSSASDSGTSVSRLEFDAESESSSLTLAEVRNFLTPLLQTFIGKRITESLINNQIVAHLQGPDPDGHFSNASTTEISQKGGVGVADFFFYLHHFGLQGLFWLVLIVLTCATLNLLSTVWISIWTAKPTDTDGRNQNLESQLTYIGVYAALGLIQALVACCQTIVLTVSSLRASTRIHRIMAEKLLSAPLSYFDNHSSGLLMNRFLQDLSNVDTAVPSTMLDQMGKTFSITSQFLLVIILTPSVMLVLPFIIFFYVYVISTFRTAARDTRRVESVARSPVYDLLSDTLSGLVTIQTFGANARFESWNTALVGTLTAAKVANEAVNKWAQALTVQSSCLLYCCAGIVGLVLVYRGEIGISVFGLVLLNAAVLQRAVMDFVMGLTNLETNFVSVERVAEFCKLKHGNPFDSFVETSSSCEVTASENSETPIARLEVKKLRLRYAINRRYVLNGVSFYVEPGDKVAIIGRTGCGKSSLFAALSQLYPPSDGSILIDGVSMQDIPPKKLQQLMRVIPQETVLFDGTVRDNITLGRNIDDEQIWHALSTVCLKERVAGFDGALDSVVTFGGEHFSSGERQLLCLARALVGRVSPAILLCDEVTSNVDLATDEIVLSALLSLPNTSVMMILHRLESLKRFDKILMLHKGRVVAFGDAEELVDNNQDVQRFLLCPEY